MKKISLLLSALCLATAIPSSVQAQSQFKLVEESISDADNTPRPVFPVPTERQLKWNETEFYAFYHYGMDTYTGKEWGNGTELESTFAPTKVPNPRQWLQAAKSAGMKGGIAVVKHHDGFCLWPTKTTTHCVTSSSSENAKATNIPRDFADAARELGMKYGFYVSPWDMSSQYWGEKDDNGNYTDNYAKKVFLPQCVELAKYGDDQFEMWFDGANGGNGYYGGKNTTINIDNSYYYDVPNLRDRVHSIAPNCVMWGVGGEARWIGNEAGWAGETNWAMMDPTIDNNAIRQVGQENSWLWHPGESDAKATTAGWFWHSGEGVLDTERLFQMYLETVGRNATLILNCPPDKTGYLPEATVNRLQDFGKLMRTRFKTDLAKTATIEVSETRKPGANRNYSAANLTDDDKDTYWATNDQTKSATITFTWSTEQTLRYLQMMEYIKLGQRIKNWTVEYTTDGATWTRLAPSVQTTTVGYKRILPLNGSTSSSYGKGFKATGLRITIVDSRACPLLSNISIY